MMQRIINEKSNSAVAVVEFHFRIVIYEKKYC